MRKSGILLHPTSLPSRFGVGDLGTAAYVFVDFLASAKQTLWQVLPLGQTGYGDSPYQCFSAFAGNIYLISLDNLVGDKLLSEYDLRDVPAFNAERVDFGGVINYKLSKLWQAFDNFKNGAGAHLKADFAEFCRAEASWLADYALFRSLKSESGGGAWNTWSRELIRRDAGPIAAARQRLSNQIQAESFFQYLFFRQWETLRKYANSKGIKIIGDIPIFVAFDSADVWATPSAFKLNKDGTPKVVAGVPPDYFSATGQLWGNPLYDWARMKKDGFLWWKSRVRATLRLVDIIRLDHFRGFAACWEVPGGDHTAERGQWVKVPGRELFKELKKEFGDLPILAEDLGVITPDVEALRDDFGFPGMRILQFAFGGDSTNHDLPHNYIKNCVVYTGTHDNDTTVGWFHSQAGAGSTRTAAEVERERQFCRNYLPSDGREIHWDFIVTVLKSVADTALIPMQDLLGKGNEARMNLPASTSGNWNWRYREHELTQGLCDRLRYLTELFGRDK